MKWLGFPDPSSSFVVKKLLGASQSLRGQVDIRLPITRGIMIKLLSALHMIFASPYKQCLVAAMFLSAFHAFLRIGEMVPKGRKDAGSCLQLEDVSLSPQEAIISILRFKSSKSQGPQFIQLNKGPAPCPVQALSQYLSARGSQPGPLFICQSGAPLLRREFDHMLKTVLVFCDLDSTRFKGHSFRIGASTEAALQGKSDAQIRLLGRWSSDAFRKYIRIN
jgi:hypothetical protein